MFLHSQNNQCHTFITRGPYMKFSPASNQHTTKASIRSTGKPLHIFNLDTSWSLRSQLHTLWIGQWVGPWARLHHNVKWKTLALLGN